MILRIRMRTAFSLPQQALFASPACARQTTRVSAARRSHLTAGPAASSEIQVGSKLYQERRRDRDSSLLVPRSPVSLPVFTPSEQRSTRALNVLMPNLGKLSVASLALAILYPCAGAGAVGLDSVTEVLQQVTADSSVAGAALFVVAYVAASVLLIPASVLTLGAGYIFGPLLGTGLVSAGSTLGAGAAFLVSRSVARPFVEQRLAGNEKLRAVDKAVSSKGAQVVLLLRLSPLFPFTLLNYGLGLSQVDFWPYLGASWAGMLPGTFAYVYLGSLGRATVDAAAGGTDSMPTVKLALYAVGAIATLAATKIVSSAAADALKEAE